MEEELKKCTRCGEVKPLTLFAVQSRKNTSYRCICRDCFNKYRREKYHGNYTKKEGIFYGTLGSYSGALLYRDGHPTIYWSDSMIAELKRLYPDNKTDDIADMMGISASVIKKKAQELHLYKSNEFVNYHRKRNIRIAQASVPAETKQKTGRMLAECGKATRFKKGESYLMTLTKEERDEICKRAGQTHRRHNLRAKRQQQVV